MSDLTGFLIINKPEGLSSFKVTDIVRRNLSVNKIGHTGTLDPFASGVLVLALNRATKLIQFLDESRKKYRAKVLIGLETDTLDPTGRVIREDSERQPDSEEVKRVVRGFSGKQDQVPPQFSAKKVGGKAAYKYARSGKQVELASVPIEIFEIEIIDYQFPGLELEITCSRGTYIRSLARDIGKQLGTFAILKSLVRLESGSFTLDRALTPDEIRQQDFRLEEKVIFPSEALSHIQSLQLKEDYGIKIINGLIPDSDWFINPPRQPGKYKTITADLIAILEFNQKKFRFLRVVHL